MLSLAATFRQFAALILLFVGATVFGQRPLGVDVSNYQGGSINWNSVKSAGVVFAFCKATEHTTFTDADFTINEANAKTAGVLIGAYHFARYDLDSGTNGAIAEAQHFWAVAKNYITNGGYYLMPVLDSEYVTTNSYDPGHYGYTKTTYSQWVNAWAQTVISNANAKGVTVKPIIYSGVSFSANWLDSTVTNYFSCWTPNWNGQDPQTGKPSGTGPFSTWNFWQYSDNGTVSGISGAVDTDTFQGSPSALQPFIIGNALGPPLFTSQPTARYGDLAGSLLMRVSAVGASTLKYQWRFKGNAIATATNSTYTLTNIASTSNGNYTVIVSNTFGAITSAVASVTVNAQYAPIFSDNFDANSSANWTVTKSSTDTRVIFAYDYSVIGVPSAPNSTNGTTKGLRFEANLKNGVVAALSASPTGQVFPPPYRLHFDMWINVNGPLPGGGVGSTEIVTAGVGTTGGHVQWNNAGADGVWFSVDGDGGVGSTSTTLADFGAWIGNSLQAVTSGVYTASSTRSTAPFSEDYYYTNLFSGGQTPPAYQQTTYPQQTGSLATGTAGLAWRDVVINNDGTNVSWFLDGLKIATVSASTITASNIFVGYWDPFSSISDNTNLSFGLIDNVRVEVPVVAASIATQPSSATLTQGASAVFTVSASGSPSPTYQWRFNGSSISGANASSYTKANAQTADAGSYSVVVSNAGATVTSSSAILTVNVPAAITAQPQSLAVNPSSNAVFTVTATGTAPLSYRWRYNTVTIAGATAASYTRTNAQAADAGSYSVVVTNIAGAVTSANAVLTVNQAPAITTQPQSQTIGQNNNAIFTVTATGTAPLSYQWRLNGANISAATTTSYTRAHVQSADAGSYSVVVTNVAGSITSAAAVLTLSPCSIHLLNIASNADGSIGLTFSTEVGNTYNFQYKTNLSDAQWTTLSSFSPTSNTLTVADSTADTQRFYRLASDCAASEIAGFIKVNLLGNSDSFVSLPFVRPPAATATVGSIVGNTITVSQQYPPAWTSNQFVYSAGTQSNNYYARFISGASQGPMYPVTANGTNTLTVDTSSNALVAAAGDLLVVEPYWSFNSVFPNGAGVNVSPTQGNRNTEILIPDFVTSGVNLSSTKFYYFNSGIWKLLGQSTDHGDDVLLPNTHFIVRQNISTTTTLTLLGVADTSPWNIALRTSDGSAGDKQDNFIGLLRPAPVSLDASGLISSGAFAASPLPGLRTDELLVFDNTVATKNKSAAADYYYWSGAWRRVGFGTAVVGGDVVFAPGTGVIIRKSTNLVSPVWTNSSPY